MKCSVWQAIEAVMKDTQYKILLASDDIQKVGDRAK